MSAEKRTELLRRFDLAPRELADFCLVGSALVGLPLFARSCERRGIERRLVDELPAILWDKNLSGRESQRAVIARVRSLAVGIDQATSDPRWASTGPAAIVETVLAAKRARALAALSDAFVLVDDLIGHVAREVARIRGRVLRLAELGSDPLWIELTAAEYERRELMLDLNPEPSDETRGVVERAAMNVGRRLVDAAYPQ